MYIYGTNAYFTDANPRCYLETPAGWMEKLNLRPLRCSANSNCQSEEVCIISVPAHSPSVYFLINTPLDQLMLATPLRVSLEIFTFPGVHSLTDCYSHCG